MELTERHEKLLQETHDAITELAPLIKEHHKTLYGNGKLGLVRDLLKFKTQVITALTVITTIFTVAIAIMRVLK